MFKPNMKKLLMTGATACLLTASMFGLAGCGKETKAIEIVPETVNNFALDFESGDFSFDFDGEAKSFYVRVFESGTKDETMPLAARRVRYRSEKTSYEGTMNLADLQPGDTFDAYVYTYVKDENGDLHYSSCDAVSGVYKTAYKTPAKNFDLNMIDGQAVVNLKKKFFTDQYLDKAPSYKITLYKGTEEVDSTIIANSDLVIEEKEVQSFMGTSIETSTTAKATFAVDDPSAEYFATVQILSSDDSAYYDSEISDMIPVTEPVEEEEDDSSSQMGFGFGEGNGFGGEGESVEDTESIESTEGAEGFEGFTGTEAPSQN